MTSNASSAASTAIKTGDIGRTARASAGTGIESTPAPRAPSTVTRTCHAPVRMSQSVLPKRCGSAGLGRARSATGGESTPGPRSGSGTTETPAMSSSNVRTSMRAIPGTTSGGRIVTSR